MKQKYISKIMTDKEPMRVMNDVDETVLSYAEIKALCAGNPLIKEKMDLDIEVQKLRLYKSEYTNQHHRLQDKLTIELPSNIQNLTAAITEWKADLKTAMKTMKSDFSIVLEGKEFTDKTQAGFKLMEIAKTAVTSRSVAVGEYRGFTLSAYYDEFAYKRIMEIKGQSTLTFDLGKDPVGNIARLNNALDGLQHRIEQGEKNLKSLESEFELVKQELEKPFEFADALTEKTARLTELNAELSRTQNETETDSVDIDAEPPTKQEQAPNQATKKSKTKRGFDR
jgi:predicted RNase H-like nuclease (RuvC/YqgF family)